ncbi:hypothetical protein IV505_05010 [Pseudomonas fulva]|nr:hypothetical protein [Pseudomonas fulva]MBF8779100.1 hypothetical protein [Pseudomonas fulva]
MNALTLNTNPAHDYREAMQEAAVAYLLRRRGQFLAGDAQVLECCKHYVAQSLEVPAHLVQRIAELAVAEFERTTSERLTVLGVCPHSRIGSPLFVILDRQTQTCHEVPARVLPLHLLQRSALSR